MRAAEMTDSLDNAKRTITAYVESRMSIFAPNIAAVVGSQTAAQLINFAGGLRGLAGTPACNIAALGSKRNTQAGLATNIVIRQQGFIYHSPLIRQVPNDLKRRSTAQRCTGVEQHSRIGYEAVNGWWLDERSSKEEKMLTIRKPTEAFVKWLAEAESEGENEGG